MIRFPLIRSLLAVVTATVPSSNGFAQAPASAPGPGDIRELKLRDWQPRSMLKTKVTLVEKPAFPVIDVHNHLGDGRRARQIIEEMDAAGVRTVVNLDGMWGDELKRRIERLDRAYPGRFLTYALIDFRGIGEPGWSERAARQLEQDFRAGAAGLKIHKSLGLGIRYRDGRLVPVDAPELDPIWEVCGRYGKPVMIHTADPAAFFTPLDRFNERWHELNEHPGWLFADPKFPRREELHAQRNRVIARHPKTIFIGAHCANNPEDLATVSRWLDEMPNLYVDIDARISELGRQPYTARRFFIRYQDRIMFGTDTFPNRESYRIYYRFLETDDEYFDCSASHHLQGFWMIYGVYLPPDVLEKIYRKNAERIVLAAATIGRTQPEAGSPH